MKLIIDSIERYEDRVKIHGTAFGQINAYLKLDVPKSAAKGWKAGKVITVR